MYIKKRVGGDTAFPQEISVLSAVGKQTLSVSVLKSLRVTEMPHIYAKYKYGFKVTDWQHQSLCAKNRK